MYDAGRGIYCCFTDLESFNEESRQRYVFYVVTQEMMKVKLPYMNSHRQIFLSMPAGGLYHFYVICVY